MVLQTRRDKKKLRKTKNITLVRTFTKSNGRIVERGKRDILNTNHRYLWAGPYMIPLIAPPPFFSFFFNIDFFFHVHNILQLSMYHWIIYIQ